MKRNQQRANEALEHMGEALRAAHAEAKPELMMPVSEDHALRQFEIEALRQITDNLKRLNDRSEKQGEVLQGIDARLIRIESNSLETQVQTLVLKVDELERDKDRRDGATSLFNWTLKNWPGLIGFVALIIVVLKTNGMLK